MEVTLSFTSKKDFNRFIRQMSENKGFVVKSHHIKGGSLGSFFRSIGNTLKKTVNDITNDSTVRNIYNTARPIIKPIAQQVLPQMANALASSRGGPIAGVVAQQATQNAVDGMGIFDNIGRKTRNTMRKVKNTGRDIQRAINSKEVQSIINSKAGRQLKEIGKSALHQAIADHHMDMADSTANPFAHQALNVIADTAHDRVEGLGIKKRGGGFKKGSAEAKAHMAKLRAMKRGRSIMPLG